MSRRSPGTQSAAGARVARARLAATMGADAAAADAGDTDAGDTDAARVAYVAGEVDSAGQPGGADVAEADAGRAAGHTSGLLDVPVRMPFPAPRRPVPSPGTASAGGDGRRSAGDAGNHAGPLHGSWREERIPLSAWLRARTGVGAAALFFFFFVGVGGVGGGFVYPPVLLFVWAAPEPGWPDRGVGGGWRAGVGFPGSMGTWVKGGPRLEGGGGG